MAQKPSPVPWKRSDGVKSAGLATASHATALHVGSCQNYGAFLGTLIIRCRISRIIIRTPKGTIILTTTQGVASPHQLHSEMLSCDSRNFSRCCGEVFTSWLIGRGHHVSLEHVRKAQCPWGDIKKPRAEDGACGCLPHV